MYVLSSKKAPVFIQKSVAIKKKNGTNLKRDGHFNFLSDENSNHKLSNLLTQGKL